ncbi:MAG: hypothetical protein JW760_15315, partial [Spirochaetales bacterium]|nr:hypothetical protein [Spirochaetales bacterium]
TGGLCMFGGFYDFFTLPRQVEEANLRLDYRKALENRRGRDWVTDYRSSGWGDRFRQEFNRDSPEKTILKAARNNNGVATPASVALEGDLSIDDAKKHLDEMASRGYAEVKITRSGTMAYLFPEFVTDPGKLDFEDL